MSLEEVVENWKGATNTKTTIGQLTVLLRSASIDVVYLSKDSRVVGLKGLNSSFQTVGSFPLSELSEKKGPGTDLAGALATIGGGAGGAAASAVGLAGAAVAAAGGLPSAIPAIIVLGSFAGFAAAGLALGAGLLALLAALPPDRPPPTAGN